MRIKGFQGTSLIDYPGNVASIIFTPGCNFRCPFCYNKEMVFDSKELPELDSEKVIAELKKRKKLIEGVVITGGEPLLHKGLPGFVKKLKFLGLKVKLDTNGTNPEMLSELIKNNLVDYIAMDIKAPMEKYERLAGLKTGAEKIKKKVGQSIKILMQSNLPYEFRTTYVPGELDKKDFEKIGSLIKGAKKFCLQQFKPMPGMIDREFEKKQPAPPEDLEKIKELMLDYVEKVELRL